MRGRVSPAQTCGWSLRLANSRILFRFPQISKPPIKSPYSGKFLWKIECCHSLMRLFSCRRGTWVENTEIVIIWDGRRKMIGNGYISWSWTDPSEGFLDFEFGQRIFKLETYFWQNLYLYLVKINGEHHLASWWQKRLLLKSSIIQRLNHLLYVSLVPL